MNRLPFRMATVSTIAFYMTLTYAMFFDRPGTAVAYQVEIPPQTPNLPYDENCDTAVPADFDEMVETAAREFNLNPKVLASTVYRESKCNHLAVGSSGEIGFGQIHPKFWSARLRRAKIIKEAKDLFDPQTNLRATAFVLDACRNAMNGSIQETFRCYNGSGVKAKNYAKQQMIAYKQTWGENPTL